MSQLLVSLATVVSLQLWYGCMCHVLQLQQLVMGGQSWQMHAGCRAWLADLAVPALRHACPLHSHPAPAR